MFYEPGVEFFRGEHILPVPSTGWTIFPESGRLAYHDPRGDLVLLSPSRMLFESRRIPLKSLHEALEQAWEAGTSRVQDFPEDEPLVLGFARQENWLVVKAERFLAFHDLETSTWLPVFLPNLRRSSTMQFSPDGTLLVTGEPLPDDEDHFAVWDWQTGSEVLRLPFVPEGSGSTAAQEVPGTAIFSPADSTGFPTLLVLDGGRRMVAWDLADSTGAPLGRRNLPHRKLGRTLRLDSDARIEVKEAPTGPREVGPMVPCEPPWMPPER